MNRFPGLALAGLFVLVAGCAGGDKLPKLHPVSGKAYGRDGKPLSRGTVQFQHATDTTLTVTGDIQPDGSFTLQTIKGKQLLPGAIEGDYTATVSLPIPEGEHAPPPPISYSRTFHVEAKENVFELRPLTQP